jgi:hypothetical protein
LEPGQKGKDRFGEDDNQKDRIARWTATTATSPGTGTFNPPMIAVIAGFRRVSMRPCPSAGLEAAMSFGRIPPLVLT